MVNGQPKDAICYLENLHKNKNMYLLAVVLTLVLERDRRLMMESPQLTTLPLLVMEKVLSLYRSSEILGLRGCSGSEHTLGRA